MIRSYALALAALAIGQSAWGHFIFIVPSSDGKSLNVVFSESLEPDDAVSLGPVAKLKLHSRAIDGKESAVDIKALDHSLSGNRPSGQIVFGSLDYGVTSRGGQSFLLKYHPKAILGSVAGHRQKLGNIAAEIVPERAEIGGVRFRVLFGDAAAAKVDVTVLLPDHSVKKVVTDADGRTSVFTAPGRYGVWARVVENTSGEYQNQKYASIRHYPTLVMDHSHYPPLPEAISSFGAAIAGGSVYVYGGHRAKVHSYDTNAVTGGFRRLNLAQPKSWEELPAGPPMQGLALVSHGGKLIRIGGMVPHNPPGTKADNRSTDSCAVFDPAANAWQPLPALPKPRSSHDAAVVGDTLIVVGGWNMRGADGDDWFDDVVTLDLHDPKAAWQSAPQPFRRRALQAAAFHNRVYVAGGLDEDGAIMGTVSVFDPATRKWSEGPSLPDGDKTAFNPGICVLQDRLYVSLGDGAVVRLSADGQKWEPVAKVMPRIVHRMVPANENTLLLIGGAARGQNLDAVEAVTLPSR